MPGIGSAEDQLSPYLSEKPEPNTAVRRDGRGYVRGLGLETYTGQFRIGEGVTLLFPSDFPDDNTILRHVAGGELEWAAPGVVEGSVDWSQIINKPVTLAGYNIQDAYTKLQIQGFFDAIAFNDTGFGMPIGGIAARTQLPSTVAYTDESELITEPWTFEDLLTVDDSLEVHGPVQFAAGQRVLDFLSTTYHYLLRPDNGIALAIGAPLGDPTTYYHQDAHLFLKGDGSTPLLDVASDGLRVRSGRIWNTDGQQTLPAYSFFNDQDTGFWRSATGSIVASADGTAALQITATSLSAFGTAFSLGGALLANRTVANVTQIFDDDAHAVLLLGDATDAQNRYRNTAHVLQTRAGAATLAAADASGFTLHVPVRRPAGTIALDLANATYLAIHDGAGVAAIVLGDGTNTTNTYKNTSHVFETRAGAANLATLNATSLNLAAEGRYDLHGTILLSRSGNFTVISDESASSAFLIGNVLDGNTYYQNTAHIYRTRDGAATMATLDAGKLQLATGVDEFWLGGLKFVEQVGDYFILYNQTGNNALAFGDATDPTNHYYNTAHQFRSETGATVFATLNATGLTLESDGDEFRLGPTPDWHAYHDGVDTYLENETGTYYLWQGANSFLGFATNNVQRVRVSESGHFHPHLDSTYDLGLTSLRFRAAYIDSVLLTAGETGRAPLNIPHGVAPSSPVDGDVWSTTSGVFARVNGTTVQFVTV